MRHVLELLDGDVARVYSDLGVPDYRPRYSPVVRALVTRGPLSIRDLAGAVGVDPLGGQPDGAQMARHGLLALERGADARQRIARLTDRARALLPLIEAEWAATDAAAAELEAELPAALTQVLQAGRTGRAFPPHCAAGSPTRPGRWPGGCPPVRSRRAARHRGRGPMMLSR